MREVIDSTVVGADPRPSAEQHLCLPQSAAATEIAEELVVRLPVALVQISNERTGCCQQRFSPRTAPGAYAQNHPVESVARERIGLRPAFRLAQRSAEPVVRRLLEDDALHAEALRFSRYCQADAAGRRGRADRHGAEPR